MVTEVSPNAKQSANVKFSHCMKPALGIFVFKSIFCILQSSQTLYTLTAAITFILPLNLCMLRMRRYQTNPGSPLIPFMLLS